MLRARIVDVVVPVTPEGAIDDIDAVPSRLRTPSVLNPLSATALISRMDSFGISQSIVPARRYGPLWGLEYEAVHRFVSQYPDRLFATAGIDPLARLPGVSLLEEAVRDLGFVGAHTYSSWSGVPADDRLYYPYYAKCAELNVPVQIECMAAKGPNPSMGRPEYIERVADDFPELTIIAMHTGYPWERELIAVAESRANVVVGCDALPPEHWAPEVKAYIRGQGYFPPRHFFSADLNAPGTIEESPLYSPNRVVFGSNYVSMDLGRALETIESFGFDDETLQRLMGSNAARIFRLPGWAYDP